MKPRERMYDYKIYEANERVYMCIGPKLICYNNSQRLVEDLSNIAAGYGPDLFENNINSVPAGSRVIMDSAGCYWHAMGENTRRMIGRLPLSTVITLCDDIVWR